MMAFSFSPHNVILCLESAESFEQMAFQLD